MLIWALIGMISGVVLGLTGAGGAIISVPLFIAWTGSTLSQATVYSLFAVFLGAVLNWYFQRKETLYLMSLILMIFSSMAAYLSISIKYNSSEQLIKILFMSVCLVSLIFVWKKKDATSFQKIAHHRLADVSFFLKSAAAGSFLGFVVTMTGLGGGVVLLPMLTAIFKAPQKSAVPTSLLIVLVTSVTSIAGQWQKVSSVLNFEILLALFSGSLVSVVLIKFLLKGLKPKTLEDLRKWVMTGIIFISVLSLLK